MIRFLIIMLCFLFLSANAKAVDCLDSYVSECYVYYAVSLSQIQDSEPIMPVAGELNYNQLYTDLPMGRAISKNAVFQAPSDFEKSGGDCKGASIWWAWKARARGANVQLWIGKYAMAGHMVAVIDGLVFDINESRPVPVGEYRKLDVIYKLEVL